MGLIGAGAIGEVHLNGFKKNPNCELVAIASRTEEHAKEFAEKFGIPHVYSGDGWKKMLETENLNAVSICSPNYLHYPMIMEALARNLHILCEKPVCITQQELEKVEQALITKNIIFFTAFPKRYISFMLQIKKLVDSGVLGKVSLVRHIFGHFGPYTSHNARSKERWFFDSKMAGGGVALDLAVHSIDIMRYVVGDYANIEGYSSATSCMQMEHEDTGNISFRFKSGALGLISVSWCCPPTEILEIFGPKGSIKLDLHSKHPFAFEPRELKINPVLKKLVKQKKATDRPHHALVDHFVQCVMNKKQENPNFDDGKKAVEFVLKAYALKKD